MWTKGYSNSAIARELGMTRSAIIGKGRRLGLPPHDVIVRGKCSRAEAGIPRKSKSLPVEAVVPEKRKVKAKAVNGKRTRAEWDAILAEAVRNTVEK